MIRALAATVLIAVVLLLTAGVYPDDPISPQGPAPDWQVRYEQEHRLSLKRYRLLGRREHQLKRAHEALRRHFRRDVDYALRLASAVYGVPLWQLQRVAYCESTDNPLAVNGKFKGLMQLGWAPFGFSPFDPIASALSAAQTVKHDGSWRQWTCGAGL
jgi:hypothetical protein